MSASACTLVVDIGQTSTRAIIADATSRTPSDPVSDEPGEHLAVPGAAARAVARIERCWHRLATEEVDDVLVSATGFDHTAAGAIARDLVRQLPVRRVVIVDDAAAEYLATLGAAPGILLILGTGCVALAFDGVGRWARQGGTGWAIGDEAGGYSIGRQGLGSAVALARRRDGPPALVEAATARFGAPSTWSRQVYGSEHPVSTVASFAADVLAAAAAGDPAARMIWERAAATIVGFVASAGDGVDLAAPRRVVIVGGLTYMPADLRRAFVGRLEGEARAIVDLPPPDPSARLAALLALQANGTSRLDPGEWVEASR